MPVEGRLGRREPPEPNGIAAGTIANTSCNTCSRCRKQGDEDLFATAQRGCSSVLEHSVLVGADSCLGGSDGCWQEGFADERRVLGQDSYTSFNTLVSAAHLSRLGNGTSAPTK